MNFPVINDRRSWYGLALLAALFAVAGYLRMNDLTLYSPDSIRYVIWGTSIAGGRGFVDDTQPDPQWFVEHAPLYPVLIAPAEFFFPDSLVAAKAVSLLWGLLALMLMHRWLSKRLGPLPALLGSLLMVCNPLLLVYSSEALSEAPFVAFLCLALVLSEDVAARKGSSGYRLPMLLAIVGTIGLLREIGVAVVAGVILYFALQKQWRRAALMFLAAAVCLGLWYVRNQILVPLPEGATKANTELVFEHFVTPAGTSLVSELWQRIWISAGSYAWQLAGSILYPLHGSGQVNLAVDAVAMPGFARIILAASASILLLFGVSSDWKDRTAAILRASIAVGYLLLVFIFPVHDIRFLFPLLPLMIFYILKGAGALGAKYSRIAAWGKPAILIPLVALVMVPNLIVMADIIDVNLAYRRSPQNLYQELVKRESYPTIYTFPWSLVGDWVRDSVAEGSTIASPEKFLAISVGQRKVLEANPGLTLPLFEKMIRDYDVAYLASRSRLGNYKLYEFLMAESKRYRFDQVFSAGNVSLFRVTSLLRHPDLAAAARPLPDTTGASGLLRQGRAKFLREDYAGAVERFSRGMLVAPGEAEFLYQTALAHSMQGNAAAARRVYEELLVSPQSASLSTLARVHLDAMDVAISAIGVPATQERAIKMNDLARLYWNLGYESRAEGIADVSLRLDSTHFWGLLWGFHFNLQNGDTADARRYYGQLERLSADNQVVVSFRRLLAIGDSLRWVRDRPSRSELHLSAGRLYQLIELFEESLDEGERALAEDPENVAAKQLLGEVFQTKGVPRMANAYYGAVLSAEPGNALVRARRDSLQSALPPR